MDNLDESETNAKVSDSAYSTSCSNSQSRRSHSSKSTHSGSNSSGSSGYGGKPSTSVNCSTLNQLPEKRTKDKDAKKKKQVQAELKIQTEVEFRLPEPATITQVTEESQNAAPPSPSYAKSQKGSQRSMDITIDKTDENTVLCNAPQSPIRIVSNKVSGNTVLCNAPQSPIRIVSNKVSGNTVICNAPLSPLLIVSNKSSGNAGFSCVISMHEGVVLYMSASLTTTLGFPKDMWIGRSFIDFVHPLDHTTFASQITNGLGIPEKVNGMQDAVQTLGNSVASMYCRLRRYRGLHTGFAIKDKVSSYMPFLLKLSFKNICDDKGMVIYLVVQATPLDSAFGAPNELVENATPFIMRHGANGNLEFLDNGAVPYLGYMPQDVIGQDVLRLYHPEDLADLMQVYEMIVKQGRVPRSRPYRILAQNGYYMTLETEWSSFINPWSRKLEFVICKHYVMEGPDNPDVFQAPPPKSKYAKEDPDVRRLKENIVRILNEVPTKPAEVAKQQMTKRYEDIASFMESLIEDEPRGEEDLRLEIQEIDNSYYERDSVMLGGISPHHDYNDSKSSTETPLSYNQLNFNINLKRYFDSHDDTFDEDAMKPMDRDPAYMNRPFDFSGCMSPMAEDSQKSTPEPSCVMYVEAGSSQLPECHNALRLTESHLSKHNSEMEKMFVKKHREIRPHSKEEREKISNETKQKKKDHLIRCNMSFIPAPISSGSLPDARPHGQKRASRHRQPDEGPHKHHCTSPQYMHRREPSATQPQPSASSQPQPNVPFASGSATTATMWPPNFVNGMGPFMPHQMPHQIPHQMPLMSSIPALPAGFVPMYYVPTPSTHVHCGPERTPAATGPTSTPHFQPPGAVPYMMYGQAVFGPPMMVSSFPVQQNVMQNYYANVQNNLTLTTQNYEEACKPGLSLRPPSDAQLAAMREQKRAAAAAATAAALAPPSVLVDGRNHCGSICSANKALNRSTEAVPDPCLSRDMQSDDNMYRTDGESSYSSFYSSFFKTESGSADDSGDARRKTNTNDEASDQGTRFSRGRETIRNRHMQRRKMEPPWMEHVSVTSELVYKYQVSTKTLNEVLLSDKKKIEGLEQPSLVNEQLGQLYMDMQLEGVAQRLTLEEGITSSGSSGEENPNRIGAPSLAKRVHKKRKYSKLVMIYEENAPLPPPDEDLEPAPSTSES